MVDLDLPTVEVDLEELAHRPVDDRGYQVGRPTVIVTTTEPFAIAGGSDHQQTQRALASSALPEDPGDFFVLHLATFSAIEDFGGFPGSGVVQPDLLGSELVLAVEATGSGFGTEAELDILAGASDQFNTLDYRGKDGAIAETAIHRQQENLLGGAAGVESSAQPAHEIHKTGREAMRLLGGPILLPFQFQRGERARAFSFGRLTFGKSAARMLHHRNLLKSDGQSTGADLGPAEQRHQQRGLQEAQAEHQVDVKLGRKRIALIEGLRNARSGFAQTRVIDGHANVAAGTPREGALENGGEQLGRIPLRAREEKVIGAPVFVRAAVGPNDARQGATPQTDQGAQRLTHGAEVGTGLREDGFPIGDDLEEAGQQAARALRWRTFRKAPGDGRRNGLWFHVGSEGHAVHNRWRQWRCSGYKKICLQIPCVWPERSMRPRPCVIPTGIQLAAR